LPGKAERRRMTHEEFRRLIERRRSIRRFEARALEDGAERKLLAAAGLAPSAGNLQAYQIVVVRDGERRGRLAEAAFGQEFVAEAPVVFAFVADHVVAAARYGSRGSDLYAVQDATIAATYVMLAAASLDLGTVWVGAFDTPAVARVLECRTGETPVALLAVGYARERPAARPRRPMAELVREL
jgi:nitroreductase